MPAAPPGWKLRKIARKTLSRGENDSRPIPPRYLQVLDNHLERYPQEENFLMDLDDGGGTIICLDCWCEVLVADAQGELQGFDAFWEHIATHAHQELAFKRLKGTRGIALKQEPIGIDMNLDDQAMTRRAMSQSIMSAPSATRSRKRVTKTVFFPTGEAFEYSTDEDEQPATMIETPNTSSGCTSPFDGSSNHISPFQSSSSFSPPCLPPSATGPPSIERQGYYNTYGPPVSDNYGSSSNSSEPSYYTTNNFDTTPRVKRPCRGYRRHDFGDGDVIYLSTDDEALDERPGASSEKKPRLGGALMKNNHGITKHEPGVMKSEQYVISSEPGSSHSLFQSPYNSFANNTTSAVPNPAPQNAYTEAANWGFPGGWQQEQQAWPHEEQGCDYQMQHDDWYADPYWEPIPDGPEPGVGMGYHAPPVAAGDGIREQAGYDYRPNAGSFNLNYDEDAPMGRLDVGGADQTEKLRDFFVLAMEDFQETPKVVDAACSLGLPDPAALLPGLEVQLMPHQLIGVSWMVAQEDKPSIRGGILADDMGLGKTVQCIATCVKNPPRGADAPKPTLVVAPGALLEQWAAEFRERTVEGRFRVHIHHGAGKLRSANQVQQYDVIITTYHTLCFDFPKDKKGKGKATVNDLDYSEDEDPTEFGPLATTEWHRIVLDEAQFIRNRRTRASRCVARLRSTYKWVLTGTPVTNTLADIYALVRFLQFRPFNDWKEFSEKIAKVQKRDPELAGQRAQALLKKCLLRRTKYTKLEGKPILQLPPRHVEVVQVEFSPEEREIYMKVEEQQKQRMSKFLKAGTVMKNYAVILVMLLRLRQVCNHPQLITADEFFESGHRVLEIGGEGEGLPGASTSPIEELKRAERLLGCQFVDEAKLKLREQATARIRAEIQGNEIEEDDCPICFDTYVDNCCITSCKHVFCGDCLNDLFKNKPNGANIQDAAYADEAQDGSRSCPVCRGQIYPNRVFKTTAFEPSPSELDTIRRETSGSWGSASEPIDLTLEDDEPSSSEDLKGKGKASIKKEDDLAGLLESLDKGDHFEPSAKMLKMVDFIKEWQLAAPKDKIICYSQWTSMIDLVEKLLARDKVGTIRFDGRMSRLARDDALARFKRRDGPSIMLISLKCGGVGLNLVEANRVLCLDLAWNAATENQAFDRVHRMGQQKDVHVKRLVVRDTVEERILNLQAKKQALADCALGEGQSQKIKKMTVRELKALFGMYP